MSSRELLTDVEFRTQLSAAFDAASFDSAKPYLESLRQGGIDFLKDFPPFSDGARLLFHSTPLWWAMFVNGEQGFDWIIANSSTRDLSFYPRDYLKNLVQESGQNPKSESNLKPLRLKIVQFLAKSGVPAIPMISWRIGSPSNGRSTAVSRWTSSTTTPRPSRVSKERPPPTPVSTSEYALSGRPSPKRSRLPTPDPNETPAQDRRILRDPRIRQLNSEIDTLKQMLSYGGVRGRQWTRRGSRASIPAGFRPRHGFAQTGQWRRMGLGEVHPRHDCPDDG